MDTLGKDLVLALRRLRRSPMFTLVALVTLALGIGANVAMFSLLDAVVLRPLPFRSPDRLVAVWPAQNFNKALVDVFEEEAAALESVAGLSYWSVSLVGEGEPERLTAGAVGVDFFDVLGVQAARGRTFAAEERDPSLSDVVVLTHEFWQRRFGGDPAVLGRTLPLDGAGHSARRVVGVLPPGFPALTQEADVFVPLDQPPGRTVATDSSWYVNWRVARLAPGTTIAAASAEVEAIARRLRADRPGLFDEGAVAAAGVVPLRDQLVGGAARTLWLLVGAVGLVLLIGCVNLANLLLARAGTRAGELAVRKALGATRRRLMQQVLTESAVLALLGGVAGVVLAAFLVAGLGPEIAARLPRAGDVGVDGRALLFALLASFAAAALFGVLPALRSARREAAGSIRGEGRGQTAGVRAHRLNRGLVALELALAVMLVAAAALVSSSFWRLAGTDPGFRAEGVLAVELAPAPSRYADAESQTTLYREVLERVRRLPGVASAGAIHLLPLTVSNWAFPYLAEDFEPRADAPLPAANFRVVTPGYFETMGVPVRSGRRLTGADRAGSEPVMLVNEAFARARWPGQEAVGKEVRVFGTQPYRIVGVVADVHQHALSEPPQPEMYVPHGQWPLGSMVVMVRARNPDAAGQLASALREAVWEVDGSIPIPSVRPMKEVLRESIGHARLLAGLLTGFGLLALVLGAIGVYGVMAYTTATRTREFAIRLALGAAPGAIQRDALGAGLRPVAVGLAIGIAATLAAGRVLAGLLFGVEPGDPVTLAAVVATLSAVALVATWVPARRAGRVAAAEVLKGE